MILLLGVILGFITLFVPVLFWPKDIPRLSGQEFIQQYPSKKWVYYLHLGLPIAWLLLYLVAISPLLWAIGDNSLYLISFVIVGGLSFAHGIIEISTAVSMRNFSRGGPAQYIVDESIKRLGWIRIGLVFVLGLVPMLFIIVFQ
jgi:hypothetical protein